MLSPDMTVREYADAWLARAVPDATARRAHLQHGILPVVGDVRLRELSPAHVVAIRDVMLTQGYAMNTLSNALHGTLSALWTAAKKDGLVSGRLLLGARPTARRAARRQHATVTRSLSAAVVPGHADGTGRRRRASTSLARPVPSRRDR